MAKQTQEHSRLTRFYPYILLVCSVIALFASVMLMHEHIAALKNPNFKAVCDINPIFSCGSVMQSDQAQAFGFDNTYGGIIGFSILSTIAAALLAGATYKKWFWQGIQIGVTLAQLFIFWLVYQSLFSIGSICLFCMTLWVTVTAAFWYTTVYNLRAGYISLPTRLNVIHNFIQRHHLDILIGFYLLLAAVITHRFWYYFSTLL
jgi:uncharacterized membrane protein